MKWENISSKHSVPSPTKWRCLSFQSWHLVQLLHDNFTCRFVPVLCQVSIKVYAFPSWKSYMIHVFLCRYLYQWFCYTFNKGAFSMQNQAWYQRPQDMSTVESWTNGYKKQSWIQYFVWHSNLLDTIMCWTH